MTYLVITRTKPDVSVTIKDGWASFVSPWCDTFFLEDLKAAVPRDCLRWDGTAKTWSVTRAYLDKFVELVTLWYNAPTIVEV